jgi:hypothetical protein
MRKARLALALLPLVAASPAGAASIVDAAGDILPSFTGTGSPDLDVTGFSVSLDPGATTFSLGAVLAGDINPALPGFYVIGVNTGAGAIRPFGSIGEPNVTFDQVIIVQKNGTATVGTTGPSLTTLISGNQFIVSVPASLLPSTGAVPQNYGFNIWPREGATLGGNSQITDFAPNNALLSVRGVFTPVPEPASWLMMLVGFAGIGAAMRKRGRDRAIAQLA